MTTPPPFRMTGNLALESSVGCPGDGLLAAGRTLEFDDGGHFDFDDLGPEITGNIDLGRGRSPFGLNDDPVEHFRDAGGMQHFFLVGNHLFKHGHLGDFLEATLAHGHVGCLGGHQQQRGVVPVSGFHRCHEVGDAGAVLGDHHGHLARGAGEPVGHHTGVAFMSDIPEGDACFGKKVGYRHKRRADNTKRMFDAVHLKHFDKGLFGGHFHGCHW